jgi:hypothetical protein
MAKVIYFYDSLFEYWKLIASLWESLGGNQKVALSYNKVYNYLEYDTDHKTLPEGIVFWTGDHRLGATLFASPLSSKKVILVPIFEELNTIDFKSALTTLDKLLEYFKGDKRFVIADQLESPIQPRSKPKKRKNKRGPHLSSTFALNRLREMYFQNLQNNGTILPRKKAASQNGISINTWREHDLELWNHWEDDAYPRQNDQ